MASVGNVLRRMHIASVLVMPCANIRQADRLRMSSPGANALAPGGFIDLSHGSGKIPIQHVKQPAGCGRVNAAAGCVESALTSEQRRGYATLLP